MMFLRNLVWMLCAALACATAAQARGNADNGKAVAEKLACASCHGADFSSPIDPAYPRIAGQHYDYLVHALQAYQRGPDRMNGRGNPVMAGIASQLTPADIQDVAAYLSDLPGKLVVKR